MAAYQNGEYAVWGNAVLHTVLASPAIARMRVSCCPRTPCSGENGEWGGGGMGVVLLGNSAARRAGRAVWAQNRAVGRFDRGGLRLNGVGGGVHRVVCWLSGVVFSRTHAIEPPAPKPSKAALARRTEDAAKRSLRAEKRSLRAARSHFVQKRGQLTWRRGHKTRRRGQNVRRNWPSSRRLRAPSASQKLRHRENRAGVAGITERRANGDGSQGA